MLFIWIAKIVIFVWIQSDDLKNTSRLLKVFKNSLNFRERQKYCVKKFDSPLKRTSENPNQMWFLWRSPIIIMTDIFDILPIYKWNHMLFALFQCHLSKEYKWLWLEAHWRYCQNRTELSNLILDNYCLRINYQNCDFFWRYGCVPAQYFIPRNSSRFVVYWRQWRLADGVRPRGWGIGRRNYQTFADNCFWKRWHRSCVPLHGSRTAHWQSSHQGNESDLLLLTCRMF